jgi:hypothetical protein
MPEVIAGLLPERRYVMNRPDKRNSRPWWRSLSSAALAVAAVAVIGFSTVTPALAGWGVGFSVGGPVYGGYYPYPAYPAYGYYPYYGGYYYGGYYPYYYGPSIDFSYSHK